MEVIRLSELIRNNDWTETSAEAKTLISKGNIYVNGICVKFDLDIVAGALVSRSDTFQQFEARRIKK